MHRARISEHPSPLEADLSAALFGGCAFRQSRSRNSGTQKTRKMADKLAQTRPINDIGRLRVNGGLVFVCLHQSRIHPERSPACCVGGTQSKDAQSSHLRAPFSA
jgi:hypothetical protein